ncbi:MAG: sigma-54-dependent transcriptional regulator [Candidatus Saccharicenans subterraneus]|uniref:Sigma-54-dependent transcriptional regulator n=1 Tax=Candidatus Saccharicenans subterraneus TaxID=2508984 RepID=A0A3E2BPT4_9BACT|nr:MAG: sigma-54-dependent transcriptional regulator [Candidatus Saccharicenans subterraneum]
MGVARYGWDDIFGYQEIKARAKLLAKQEVDVLIIGETGTGKKLFAEAIHNSSTRNFKPFITVDLPSIPNHLFESELFGHKKGSFTDAREDKIGLIESASTGTIFLDEIGDLSLECQTKLLRLLEEKTIRRIGENFERNVDVRILMATNRNLRDDVSSGKFRADLLFRINKYVLEIPPLRKRAQDFREIAEGVWGRIIKMSTLSDNSSRFKSERLNNFREEEIALLWDYDWPGNIRQLEALLSRVFFYWRESNFKKHRFFLIEEELDNEKIMSNHSEFRRKSDPFEEMTKGRLSFWEVVHKRYLKHEISRDELKDIIIKGLEKSGWSFKRLLTLFNIKKADYKKFLNFLQGQGIKLMDLRQM